MKSNELRIGNIVKSLVNNEEFSIVDEIGHKGALGYYVSLNNQSSYVWLQHNDRDLVLPIPLTEEWLLKFGFEDITQLDNIDFKEYRMINEYSFCVQFPCGVEAHCYAGNYPIAIKYLHQLQNLYFALTGKELTMK